MDDRERDLADLAALADGSLPVERRAEVERRVAASPELSGMLARQRRALEAVHAAAGPAPASLRARVARRPVPRRRPMRAALGLAAAATAAALLALVVLPGGADTPSVAEAAALAEHAPTGGPPPRYDGVALLDREIGGIWFPRWQERFGWRASGVREDRLRGRRAATVYYVKQGRRIAYTIVDGSAVPWPSHGRRVARGGTSFSALRLGGRAVITWRRRGHTCVLSGAAVRRGTLLALASWRADY